MGTVGFNDGAMIGHGGRNEVDGLKGREEVDTYERKRDRGESVHK